MTKLGNLARCHDTQFIKKSLGNNINIYITSNEEIKEGNWFYNILSLKPEPFKACENGDGYVNCSKYSHYRIDCKKIILTTNQDLIKDGIQAIDDEFLEWFVKNPSCEFVKVEEYFDTNNMIYGHNMKPYKIIIPKEEPKQECTCENPTDNTCDYCEKENKIKILEEAKKRAKNYMSLKGALEPKQETLEEAAERYAKSFIEDDGTIEVDFIEGAKWQAERMYSEEDMIKFHKWAYLKNRVEESDKTTKELLSEWFEQFKKK